MTPGPGMRHHRMEEFNAKYGPLESVDAVSVDVDPSWGPLGSLAKASLTPAEYDALVHLDAQIAALERQRSHASNGRVVMQTPVEVLKPEPATPPEVWQREAS